MTESLPPHRDLPPGRLEARRRHLRAEIRGSQPRRRSRPLITGVAVAVLAVAIAVTLSFVGSSHTRTKVVYRPQRLVVFVPSAAHLDGLLSADLHSDMVADYARHGKIPANPLARLALELRREGVQIRPAARATPAVGKTAALAAARPFWHGFASRPPRAWLVRKGGKRREQLVWMYAVRNACIPSYGPVGGAYRETLVGFVDATTGKPLYAVTVSGGRPRRC
jgi:hypothetical protein